MDNAQKAIMIGVGLFIAIIIISAVLLITNLGTGLIDDAKGNLSNISTQLQQQLVTEYDAKIVQGSEALAAVRKYYTDNKLAVYVTNGSTAIGRAGATYIQTITGTIGATDVKVAATAVITYGATLVAPATGTANRTAMANFTDVTNDLYINPLSTYSASVIRHATTNAVIGIAFAKTAA